MLGCKEAIDGGTKSGIGGRLRTWRSLQKAAAEEKYGYSVQHSISED